jgi:hypothetical protein
MQGSPPEGVNQVMLPARLTEGIIVRRTMLAGRPVIASNVPPLRHESPEGFDFGSDGPGASDLALACVHAILERMDYAGPVRKVWDGSRVYVLALDLQASFQDLFVSQASGEELLIPWNQALGWMRRTLLERVRREHLSSDCLIEAWRRSVDSLPDPLPETELDRAETTRRLRTDLIRLTGEASILDQFLGLIG